MAETSGVFSPGATLRTQPKRARGLTEPMKTKPMRLACLALTVTAAACTTSPSPSAPAAGPSTAAESSGTASPTEPDSDQVVRAFVELASDPGLTMHVEADVSVSAAGGPQILSIVMDMDVAGNDGVGSADMDLGTGSFSFEMLLLGDRAYVDNNGRWQELPSFESTTPLNPFITLDRASDVEYMGQVNRGGEILHQLRPRDWIGGDIQSLQQQGWRNVRLESQQVDILVDEEGVPVYTDMEAEVSGRFQGARRVLELTAAYEFSDVGEPVEIPRPG